MAILLIRAVPFALWAAPPPIPILQMETLPFLRHQLRSEYRSTLPIHNQVKPTHFTFKFSPEALSGLLTKPIKTHYNTNLVVNYPADHVQLWSLNAPLATILHG